MRPSTQSLIAFVSNNSWSVFNFRLPVIQFLQAQGFRVLVIAPTDDYTALLLDAGCLHEHVDLNNRSTSVLADLQYYRTLKKIYARRRPAMIFHFVAKPNIYGSLAAGKLGIPSVAVITGLGYAFDRKNWLNKIVKSLYRFSLKKSAAVWFLNKEDAAVFIREKLVPESICTILPGEGVDTKHFDNTGLAEQTTGKVFTFLMSCRLLQSKGIPLYAAAAAILRSKGHQFECQLIGDYEKGHPDNILPAQLDKWQQEGLIRYLGFTTDVRPRLQSADCCVLPSYYHEGIPRSLMEAASMQLPLITSDSSGCRELVKDQVTGYLCRLKDPVDLAAKMEKMLLLPRKQRQEMGLLGRELMVSKFDISHVLEYYRAATNRFIV